MILWFLQTNLLNGIYSAYTKETIKSLSGIVSENIDNSELDSLLISISQEHELSLYLLSEDGIIKSATERSTNLRFDKASEYMSEFWDLASSNEGIYVTELSSKGVFTDSGTFLEYDPSHFVGNVPKKNNFKSMLAAEKIISDTGENFLLIIVSRIEPLSSTGEVLKRILNVATVMALFVGIIFAYIASKGLAKPIKKLSDSAEQLATGDYDVVFEGGGCSEITQLSNTLNNTTKTLRKNDTLSKELLANVSHDLRTPLTMIGGYGEMMRDIPGENTAENIQIIIDEASRLTRLVNDILDLSKLQGGTYTFRPTVFCITDEAYDIANQFEKLSAGKSTITFISKEDIYIKADETLVSEAIYNLVNNAVSHSGETSFVIIKQEVIEKNVRLSVIDNGHGIPKDQLEDIWERYMKGTNSTTGTGLGLAIVNSAVKICGGTCGVKSELEKGSEFWIEFPIYNK